MTVFLQMSFRLVGLRYQNFQFLPMLLQSDFVDWLVNLLVVFVGHLLVVVVVVLVMLVDQVSVMMERRLVLQLNHGKMKI